MKDLDRKRVDKIIRFALKEDIWTGDVTSEAVLNRLLNIEAVILSRSKGIVCGMDIAERVFASVDVNVKFKPMVSDGDQIEKDREIAFLEGDAHSILKCERTALNFMGMLSGVATRTGTMVDRVKGTKVRIFDTRKTLPLHRYLQKYAVCVGGGHNHRKGLWDMVLIKDNHIRVFKAQIGNSDEDDLIKEIVKRARKETLSRMKTEIEVETLSELKAALGAGPDVVMLDNMTPQMVSEAVAIRDAVKGKQKVLLEVSGGITLKNVREYAQTGVDIISSGYLTADVAPLDFSLEVIMKDI